MLINQQITDDLKSHIWQLDWQNCCDDKAKYTTDETYREQVKNDWFTKLETGIDEYKDKVISQFTANGFIVDYNDQCYSSLRANICRLTYKLKYSKNDKTNPFEADIKIVVNLENEGVIYNWYIDNPVRIYYKKYLNWGNRNACNHMLFTRRGFARRYGYSSYRWAGTIDEWAEGTKAKDICNKLKKTITDMECEHEKLQKGVQQKKKELHIQEDEVFGMMTDLNTEFKNANVKFLFNGECNFDYVDSPIRFNIVCSNNPRQDDENLYVKEGVDIAFEDGPWPDGTPEERAEWQKTLESHKMRLFSDNINPQSGYYRNHITISLVYRPNVATHWHYEISHPISNKIVKNMLGCETYGDYGTLDEVKEQLTNIFRRDNSLYNTIEEWKNGLN